MSSIRVCRKHDLDAQQCGRVAEDLLNKLVQKMGGSYTPEGEHYVYKHSTGVKAKVEPKQGELNIDIKLGLMTRALAPKLEQEINRQLDKHFQ